ncbi:TPA: hypothetical protein ACP44Y_005222, partial [Klebsiella quasipneumoniae]
HCIIPAVAATAHARYQIIGPAEPLPVITAILTALDALLGGRLENGIYGHSRFCNTDFDDKLACLNLSGV